MGNKAHLRPRRKKRQARWTTGLLLVVLFIALVGLAIAVAASGHAILPAGRIIPLRRGPLSLAFKARARCVLDRAAGQQRHHTAAGGDSSRTTSACMSTAASRPASLRPKRRGTAPEARQPETGQDDAPPVEDLAGHCARWHT
jgi:hypothetical protein